MEVVPMLKRFRNGTTPGTSQPITTPASPAMLLGALLVNFAGVVLTLLGWGAEATAFFVVSAALAIVGLRMFEPALHEPKIRGVHPSFPFFVRMAYGWLLAAALLGVGAALWDSSGGIWGASRHALTVGFIAVMVMCVGQRILPAFAGMRLLWSTRLMLAGLVLVTVGCALRVSSEVLAYQGFANSAWSVLPVSAVLELAGITAFAMNIFGTFILEPSHVRNSADAEAARAGAAETAGTVADPAWRAAKRGAAE